MKKIHLLSIYLFGLAIIPMEIYSQSKPSIDEINVEAISTQALMKNFKQTEACFTNAYNLYPDLPRGILEAVSYHYTHFVNITSSTQESCIGLPRVYGVMGLTLDGKGYFNNNLQLVSKLSGFSEKEIIEDPKINVIAFAAAIEILKSQMNISENSPEKLIPLLRKLSELNTDGENIVKDYSMNLYLYGILAFMNNSENQKLFNFPAYNINLNSVFGDDNVNVYSSNKINLNNNIVSNNNGQVYSPSKVACPDYPFSNCSWVSTTNHYSGRNGHTLSAIAIHTVQGSYTSCINWFQNTSASASTQYVVASNSSYAGQVTQMVLESDAAWHVTTENWYTVGYEHEGFVDDPSWYTNTMYTTSAALTRDICADNNIDPLRTFFRDTLDNGTAMDFGLHNLGAEGSCIKIKGHQHFPSQSHTDPGPNWNWNYYYKLINNNPTINTIASTTGNFYDSGGLAANYGNDERTLTLIQPPAAASITLTFTSFNVEADYDFMYIYNGPTTSSQLIGRFNTLSPGTITSTGGSLLIEFRSDCATTGTGWIATWTTAGADAIAPTTAIVNQNNWVSSPFDVSFTDVDNVGGSGVEKSFYQVMDYNGTEWRANKSNGFFNDNFNSAIHSDWTITPGSSAMANWSISSGHLLQSNDTVANSNIYTQVIQDSTHEYLYQWSGYINGTSTTARRWGMHIFSDNPTLPNRGNSYLIWFRADANSLQIYETIGDVLNTRLDVPLATDPLIWYDFKVTYSPITGVIKVYLNDALVGSWTDTTPLKTGNYISLRNGSSAAQFDDVKVRKSRGSLVNVSVGAGATNDVRFQSPNSSQEACRINTIVKDVSGNWSTQVANNTKVDWVAPTTTANSPGIWKTADFTATYTDNDNLSGIEKSYYQVIENNGTDWVANNNRGFFIDNFDNAALPFWTDSAGTWGVTSGALVQTDELENNSNIFAAVNQTLSNRYLYHFNAKVEGTGTNRRFGFHFFCDDASFPNRNNSYFIWFRVESQKLEFYKVANDIFTQTKVIENVVTNSGQFYDFKIVFDRITGKMDVYRDEKLIGTWTDPTPNFTQGNYISFRTGNSKMTINDMNVFRSRALSTLVGVGNNASKEIRFENPSPGIFGAKIKSIVIDTANNLSSINAHDLNIDFSNPDTVITLNDGISIDIDTTFTASSLSANWSTAFDGNSGITKYWYSIGTSIGGSDIVGWTDNGTSTNVTAGGLNLVHLQKYFVNIKSENGAGLQSIVQSSDGQIYFDPFIGIAEVQNENTFSVSPNPFSGNTIVSYSLLNSEKVIISIVDVLGQEIQLSNKMESSGKHSLVVDPTKLNLSGGIYFIKLLTDTDEKTIKILEY
ncbi:MAG: N-acetylmuramoyl-L-alanine amidase [Bacteroidetes bacterium]|nr:N-acetylmuramoyl-L-alanine amidase [Bacteroidota bacterium]